MVTGYWIPGYVTKKKTTELETWLEIKMSWLEAMGSALIAEENLPIINFF